VTLYDWKNLSITQVILAELRGRQQALRDELATSAGVDPLADRYRVGVIAAYEDMLSIELDNPEETHN